METDFFDMSSDCSSELSETQSELESRIYSLTHHNDFSGTSELPCIDPRYGVEFNSNGEAIVFLKDPADKAINCPIELPEVCNNRIIPTITLDDSDDALEISNDTPRVIDNEYAETSLKKKRKKKKKNLSNESIEEYINIVKTTNALKEYKEKTFPHETAMPLPPDEVLKQYRIGKPTKSSLWYRCPKTWTPDMIKFYTRIQKSKRNFDCSEELKKIRDTYGSSPVDWILNPMDLYKSNSYTNKVRCYSCRQYGHTAYNCEEQYKPDICIMCGAEGHNIHSCNKKICFSCGTWQKKFIESCSTCLSMSQVKCNVCNTLGHESNYCTESWRQFHNTISTEPEFESDEFTQSTSKSIVDARQSTSRQSENSSLLSTPNVIKISNLSPKTDESGRSSKRTKRLKRLRSKKKRLKTKNQNNSTISPNESINIDVNIQDVTLKRTLTKKNFFKKKKLKVNS
ncbi:zinc finger CCHC domain-containing protein 7-like isoform X2 [Sipha flava]|uniref:Zinc finger CCHC domain-containing protein 7 n=1 Tax=Sipha flava TaxID=143950 RepID=A0A8B8FSC4_9HEMI|nr:zinc finger CCHC domain-containing protein 7-like isoform X2 [Sipha flava]